MDPLTQGLLGAAASQALFSRQLGRWAFGIGLVAGMAADVDVFFTIGVSEIDKVLYHRHFTHALIFIPLGGLIAALPFFAVKSLRYRRPAIIGAGIAAYATHGLLDACTAYGTVLFWPFSDQRAAFDFIAIIDPIFTLILLIGVIIALVKRNCKAARIGLLIAGFYMALGAVQHQRALDAQQRIYSYRFDEPTKRRVMPTMGNIIVWRSVYSSEHWLRTDAVRVPLFGDISIIPGETARRISLDNPPKGLKKDTPQWAEFEKFLHFADGYAAYVKRDQKLIGDFRYSMESEGVTPIWWIELNPDDPDAEPKWHYNGENREEYFGRLWQQIIKQPEEAKPLREFRRPD